jgi:hypothetical protein
VESLSINQSFDFTGNFSTVQADPANIYFTNEFYGNKADFMNAYGMKWTDFRRMFSDLWESGFDDDTLKQNIGNQIYPFIPTRTGHLYDTIMRDMFFTRDSSYHSRHALDCQTDWPGDRPYPIKGNVSHIGEKGYGEMPLPPLKFVSPLVNGPFIGPRGGLYWMLNDMSAENDPSLVLEEEILKAVEQQAVDLFQGLKITMHIITQNKGGTAVLQIP